MKLFFSILGVVILISLLTINNLVIHDQLEIEFDKNKQLITIVERYQTELTDCSEKNKKMLRELIHYRMIEALKKQIHQHNNLRVNHDTLQTILDFHANNNWNLSLILAVVEKESSYRTKVISHVGAVGLTQVNYPVWKRQLNINKRSDLFDPQINLEIGFNVIFKEYLDMADGDIELALLYFNNGPSGARSPNANIRYVKQVLTLKEKYDKMLKQIYEEVMIENIRIRNS